VPVWAAAQNNLHHRRIVQLPATHRSLIMLTPQAIPANRLPNAPLIADVRVDQEQSSDLSAVAWGAILAGAATAASLWMILMILGAGLGLSSIPLWLNADIAVGTIGAATIAWLVFSQLAASGMGGYIAGRMRFRWLGVPRDEVWFRDTAHGFLACGFCRSNTCCATQTNGLGACQRQPLPFSCRISNLCQVVAIALQGDMGILRRFIHLNLL